MKLTYRPEIDGLRAIAVGAVILYHAQINILGHQPFKGGFIGVDIFFVISGYLITSIILKELVTTGSFSFKHFYERRIRRILPALLFVMLVSLPIAWKILLPSSIMDFSKSILYSLGFVSNFYFHYSGQIYGSTDGLLKPFLHTWSLSVEEQYYILFPIVLLITFKYFRKYLIHTLVLGLIISLGLAEWTSRNYPSISFYFLHTRMWELLAGSILAYFEITKGHRSKNQLLNITLPTIGLILISHSIIFFDNNIFHPSFFTLSPVIGVCLIIWFSHKDELVNKILSTKLFVGIGLISYSLYLWHYPIFSFYRNLYFFFPSSLNSKIFIILLLFVTS
ncbi:acyltransferase, partial [Candidatus Pelagibacter sp.]|nr:acyltransferase [Candidatus Pelagibacter sp.]